MERVMIRLAEYFSQLESNKVHLILFAKTDHFFKVPDRVIIHQPNFNYKAYLRPVFTLKIMAYLRNSLKKIKPDVALSFGGRYNSFVLVSAYGTGVPVFISDRSRPSISYGKFLDILNRYVYRSAKGIIAQTGIARDLMCQRTGHQNIQVIGNPIRWINGRKLSENIILNVGRFIPSKKQDLLLDVFKIIDPEGWKLIFIGHGQTFNLVRQKAVQLELEEKVIFAGQQSNVDDYYCRTSIFAFTSTSEGFPNALGEAMAAGCACISFDCEAGPSELIDDGINGFLVPVCDHEQYKQKLQLLIDDPELRQRFGEKAREKMKQFSVDKIAHQYLEFLLAE